MVKRNLSQSDQKTLKSERVRTLIAEKAEKIITFLIHNVSSRQGFIHYVQLIAYTSLQNKQVTLKVPVFRWMIL